jgi:hypothetical protein
VIVDVGAFLVKAGDWRDAGEVLNLHAVHCTGKDGKVIRNTKNRATSEIRSPNLKFRDDTIDRRRLNDCIKHHETERKEFCGTRGTARGRASSCEVNSHRQKTKSSTQLKFGEPLEAALGTWVRTTRKSKFKATRRNVQAKFKAMLEGQDHLAHLVPFVVNSWCYRWLKRMKLASVVQRELNTTRAMWCTSASVKMHCETLEQVFLDTEIASGHACGPGGTSVVDLKWVKPGLVASCDESRVTTNGKNEAHSNTIGPKGDNGETLVHQGSKGLSFLAGTYLDFTPLPTMAVFGSGPSFDPDWNRDGIPDMALASNPKGSVNEDIFSSTPLARCMQTC